MTSDIPARLLARLDELGRSWPIAAMPSRCLALAGLAWTSLGYERDRDAALAILAELERLVPVDVRTAQAIRELAA